jgi:hypothetical protein
MQTDTHPKISKLQTEMMRQAPPWKKAAMLGEMYQAMVALSLSGLRARHPTASEAELHRRLVDLILGHTLAERVYGPLVIPVEVADKKEIETNGLPNL